MNALKNYASSLILIVAVAIGAIIGLVWGKGAAALQPIGDLFLNLIFMIVTPLVFFAIAASVANVSATKKFGKLLIVVIAVILGTSIVAGVLGLVGFLLFPVIHHTDASVAAIMDLMKSGGDVPAQGTVGSQIVNALTTDNFINLLSRKYMLPLIVFAAFVAFVATRMGDRAKSIISFFETGRDLMLKAMKYIMYAAPVGLLCYFASTIGQLGSEIVEGYLKGLIVYIVIAAVYFFGVFTVYAFIAQGPKGIPAFWKNVVPLATMSLASCSSAACIPINIDVTRKMGVQKEIADLVIPLGTNAHKEGSVIGGVFKIVFIFAVFGRDMPPLTLLAALGVSILVGTAMIAIPVGGMVAELIILTVFGFPPEAIFILYVISTIIDPVATMLNATGQSTAAMLVNRFVKVKDVPEEAAEVVAAA